MTRKKEALTIGLFPVQGIEIQRRAREEYIVMALLARAGRTSYLCGIRDDVHAVGDK